MIQRQISIESPEQGAHILTFSPGPDVNFDPVAKRIPASFGEVDIIEPTRANFQEQCQKACGQSICSATVFLDTIHTSETTKRINRGVLECSKPDCPLDEPPSSGDHEPREPNTPLPTLSAQLDNH